MSDSSADNSYATESHLSDNEKWTEYDWLAIGFGVGCVVADLLVLFFPGTLTPGVGITFLVALPLTLGIAAFVLSFGRVVSRTTEAMLFVSAVLIGGLNCLVFCLALASLG